MVNYFMEIHMSKTQSLLRSFESGAEYTAKQISGSFCYKNPARAVHYLRSQGHCIYSNQKTLSTGEKVTKYRLGKPSKRMVAVANHILGANAFTR
jgi:hypothetical protein